VNRLYVLVLTLVHFHCVFYCVSSGHEYVRHLSGEIGKEYDKRTVENKSVNDLVKLVDQIVPFFLSTNAEYDAIDLLQETSKLNEIIEQTAADTYDRVAKYILACTGYVADMDDLNLLLNVAYDIYMKHKALTDALRVAIKLGDKAKMYATFEATDDELVQKQLAFILGYHKIVIDEIKDRGDELAEIMGNVRLHDYYLQLASDLDVKEPKSPEDIYKTWLEEGAPGA
jgi:26S proteasome regulatory subunit N1